MIYGIGTDICSIHRIAKAQNRSGEKFVRKILTNIEFDEWVERKKHNMNRAIHYLATRFCAKEAVGKALGLGIRWPMGWQNCSIVASKTHEGKPEVLLHEPLLSWCQKQQLTFFISLSDDQSFAIAHCLIERATT